MRRVINEAGATSLEECKQDSSHIKEIARRSITEISPLHLVSQDRTTADILYRNPDILLSFIYSGLSILAYSTRRRHYTTFLKNQIPLFYEGEIYQRFSNFDYGTTILSSNLVRPNLTAREMTAPGFTPSSSSSVLPSAMDT